MNRRQRATHARLWPVLLLLLACVCTAALAAKSAIDATVAQSTPMRVD